MALLPLSLVSVMSLPFCESNGNESILFKLRTRPGGGALISVKMLDYKRRDRSAFWWWHQPHHAPHSTQGSSHLTRLPDLTRIWPASCSPCFLFTTSFGFSAKYWVSQTMVDWWCWCWRFQWLETGGAWFGL